MEHVLDKENVLWTVNTVKTKPENHATMTDWKSLYITFVSKSGSQLWDTFVLQWTNDMAKAIRTMMAYADPPRMQEIKTWKDEKKTASEIWEALKTKYDKVDAGAQSSNWDALLSLNLPSSASYQEVVKQSNEFHRLSQRIIASKVDLNEVMLTLSYRLYRNRFRTMVETLESSKPADLKSGTVIQKAIQSAKRDEEKSDNTTTESRALATTTGNKRKNDSSDKRNNNRSRRRKLYDEDGELVQTCSHCHKIGHTDLKCWSKHPEKNPHKSSNLTEEEVLKRFPHLRQKTTIRKERNLSVGEKND